MNFLHLLNECVDFIVAARPIVEIGSETLCLATPAQAIVFTRAYRSGTCGVLTLCVLVNDNVIIAFRPRRTKEK
jgi:hypothetical protein